MKKQTLIARLFSSYVLLALAAVLLMLIFASAAIESFYFEESINNLQARAILISEIFAKTRDMQTDRLDSLCKDLGHEIGTRITVIDQKGIVLADSDEDPAVMDLHGDRPEVVQAMETGEGVSRRSSYTLEEEHLYYARKATWSDAEIILRVSYPTVALNTALSKIEYNFAWSGLSIILLIALVNWYLSRQIIKPIKVMETGAQRFARGKLKLKVPVSNISELGNLADSLNIMADQIFERIRTITQQKNEQIAILSSMTEGVIAVDPDSRILSMNRAAESMFGIRMNQVTGRHFYEVIRHIELIDLVNRTLENKASQETRIEVFEPAERLLNVVGSRMPRKKGALGGAVIVFTDLTRIQKLEGVRREFVANVSHELKTPITSIQGYVETLQEGALKDPEHAEKFLNIIAKHARRLGQIVDDLLELSRIEEMEEGLDPSFKLQSFAELIESSVQNYQTAARERSITFKREIDTDIKLPLNAKLMSHALANLIDNAIKYSESGTEITLRCKRQESQVVLELCDQGPGIDRNHLDRIFERFYRVDKGRSRDVGGTGLGLSIVKHIVRIHGAKIEVESALGEGSTFRIIFPV